MKFIELHDSANNPVYFNVDNIRVVTSEYGVTMVDGYDVKENVEQVMNLLHLANYDKGFIFGGIKD